MYYSLYSSSSLEVTFPRIAIVKDRTYKDIKDVEFAEIFGEFIVDKTVSDWGNVMLEVAQTADTMIKDRVIKTGQNPIEDPRFAGYCERRTTHIRKLMMLMSVSRGDDLILDETDFDRALKVLKATELKMHRTFGGLGQAKYAYVTENVINFIRAVGITTRKVLMQKFYRDVDSGTLKIIEETIAHIGVVRITIMPDQGGEKKYEWVGKRE